MKEEIKKDGLSAGLAVIAERIRSRRTTKLFHKRKISEKLIKDAVEVARWAPNHHLTEPWHFYLLGPQMVTEAAELIATIIRENKEDEHLANFKQESALAMPGWLLVTCKRSEDLLRQQEDYASCCCAVQNLSLYLSEAGVAMKWTTGDITRDPRLFELMGIDFDDKFVVGLFWYGYPRSLPKQSRKNVDEILTETY